MSTPTDWPELDELIKKLSFNVWLKRSGVPEEQIKLQNDTLSPKDFEAQILSKLRQVDIQGQIKSKQQLINDGSIKPEHLYSVQMEIAELEAELEKEKQDV